MHVFQSWPSFCKPLATSVHLFRILENWTLTNIWRFSLLKRWNIFSIYSMYPLVVLSFLPRLTWFPIHNVGCVTFKNLVDYDLIRLSVQMYHFLRTYLSCTKWQRKPSRAQIGCRANRVRNVIHLYRSSLTTFFLSIILSFVIRLFLFLSFCHFVFLSFFWSS